MLVKVCTSASGSLESWGTGLEAMESSLPILGAGLPRVWGVKASSQQQREARDAELLKASEKWRLKMSLWISMSVCLLQLGLHVLCQWEFVLNSVCLLVVHCCGVLKSKARQSMGEEKDVLHSHPCGAENGRCALRELGGHGDAHLGCPTCCPGLSSFSVVVGWEDLCEAACFTWLRSAAWLLESVLRVHASTC